MGIEDATKLHKPIRRKFKRRRVMVFNIDDIWSADLDTSKESYIKKIKVINIYLLLSISFLNTLILFLLNQNHRK